MLLKQIQLPLINEDQLYLQKKIYSLVHLQEIMNILNVLNIDIQRTVFSQVFHMHSKTMIINNFVVNQLYFMLRYLNKFRLFFKYDIFQFSEKQILQVLSKQMLDNLFNALEQTFQQNLEVVKHSQNFDIESLCNFFISLNEMVKRFSRISNVNFFKIRETFKKFEPILL